MVSETKLALMIISVFGIIFILFLSMLPLMFVNHHFILPLVYGATINTTANLQVPLSVKVSGADQGTTPASSTPAFDAATITTMAGLATAFIYRWKKSDKHEAKFNDRTTTGAQTTMQTAESLKQTDTGIADTLSALNKAIALIPGVPPEATKLIQSQLESWQKDNDAYYNNSPAKATDLSSDPVVKKLGEVQKITEKNE